MQPTTKHRFNINKILASIGVLSFITILVGSTFILSKLTNQSSAPTKSKASSIPNIASLSPEDLPEICNGSDFPIEIERIHPTTQFTFTISNDLMYPVRPVEAIAWFLPTEGTVNATVNGTESPLKPLPWRPHPITGWNYGKDLGNATTVAMVVTAITSEGQALWGCGIWTGDIEIPPSPSPSHISIEKRVAYGDRSPQYCMDRWSDTASSAQIPSPHAPSNTFATFCYKIANIGNASGTNGIDIRPIRFSDEFISTLDGSDDRKSAEGCIKDASGQIYTLNNVTLAYQDTMYCKIGLGDIGEETVISHSRVEIHARDAEGAITTDSSSASININNNQEVVKPKLKKGNVKTLTF